MLNTTTTET